MAKSESTPTELAGWVRSLDFPTRHFTISPNGSLTLGSSNIWWDQHHRVDGEHCIIDSVALEQDGGFLVTITDCGAKGTFLDGIRLLKGVKTPLYDGVIVSMGGTLGEGISFEVELAGPIGHVRHKYSMRSPIGEATLGQVWRATERNTRRVVAIRRIKKDCLQGRLDALRDKIHIMSSASHPHITPVREFFEDKDELYIVAEFARFGNLRCEVVDGWGMEALRVKTVTVSNVCDGTNFLHRELDLVHGNIKPENVLIVSRDPLHAKLADFDFARVPVPAGGKEHLRDAKAYTAPELLASSEAAPEAPTDAKSGRERKVDSWSLGVLLFYMLSGLSPFESSDDPQTEVRWTYFPVRANREARNLTALLLKPVPEERLSVEDALAHRWLKM